MENKFNFKKLEKRLITLYGKINTIEAIEKHRGTKFNIFSILGIERREVDTHSYFIYELINPEGTHFQGDKYLKIFIESVLEIEDFEFEGVKVGRETFTNTSRRIDFTIENDKYYIAIEMKIDAGDQDKQLHDYYHFAKESNKEVHLFYLTLSGKEASEESHQNIEYKKISFTNDISNFIEKSIEKSANLPIIRESLIQYKYLIEKITNQSTEEVKMEVVKIIDSPEIAQAANEMSKSLSYVWALKEVRFWKTLANKLNDYSEENQYRKAGWDEVLYSEHFCNEKDELIESNDEIANNIASLNKQDDVGISLKKENFLLYIYARRDDYVSFQIEGLTSDKIELFGQEIGISKKYGNKRWINSKHKISFSTTYYPTYDIFNDKKLEDTVENIFTETISYFEKIVKALN